MAVKTFTFGDVDKGIATDLLSTKVAWADGNNVRLEPGFISKTLGKKILEQEPGAGPVRAIFTFIGTDGAVRSIVCCDSKIYGFNVDFSSYSDITPTPAPSGGADDFWQFGLVGGMAVVSNGKDVPWSWYTYGSPMDYLINTTTVARHISSCMNRVVISNLDEMDEADANLVTYTGRVRWSDTGDPWMWDTDLKQKGGRHDMMDYETGIQAFITVRAQITRGHKVYFFTDRGLWECDYTTPDKHFIKISSQSEILGTRAVCKRGGKLYFIGKDDFYVSGGGEPEGIGLPIVDECFDNLNLQYAYRSFAFAHEGEPEIWFCVPTGANEVPNKAFIYNEETKSWTIQDVDFLCHSLSFDATGADIPFDIVGTAAGYILQMDDGFNSSDGTAMDGRIESGDMDFDAPDQMKRISEVIPELKYQDTMSELMVQVGLRNRLSDDLKWSDPMPFTIGASDKVDFNGFRKEGKFVRVRFYSNLIDSPWKMSGYTIKYELGGTR